MLFDEEIFFEGFIVGLMARKEENFWLLIGSSIPSTA
jgi:membrane protease YdiL (CAAX protease family)